MAELKLSAAALKVLKSARQKGIDIKVGQVMDSYYANAYSKKDLMDCLREFEKKLPSSKLTIEEYGMYCLNEISVRLSGRSQAAACRAALERLEHGMDGVRKFEGALEPYFETGTEGTIWSVQEDGEQGYEGLHPINTGDHLTIYDKRGKILFKGKIFPDHKAGWKEYPLRPGSGCGQPCALNHWIHWTQIGWQPDEWARFFLRGKNPPLRAKLMTYK